MNPAADLRGRLLACPRGHAGWRQFEDICLEALTFLFVPPLMKPIAQERTFHGTHRRDAVLPNRNTQLGNNWGHLFHELAARMILFEFKNYDGQEVGHEEVSQTGNYMTEPMGRLALLCCSKMPDKGAHRRRNSIYSQDKKVILFVTTDKLIEMIDIKERGDDPSDLIMDMVERFYLQHE